MKLKVNFLNSNRRNQLQLTSSSEATKVGAKLRRSFLLVSFGLGLEKASRDPLAGSRSSSTVQSNEERKRFRWVDSCFDLGNGLLTSFIQFRLATAQFSYQQGDQTVRTSVILSRCGKQLTEAWSCVSNGFIIPKKLKAVQILNIR